MTRTLLIPLPWLLALLPACGQGEHGHEAGLPSFHDAVHGLSSEGQETIETFPPPFSEGIFPCSDCHDPSIPINRQRRELELAHTEIELRHDEEHRWCLDCHSAESRDMLHLANGTLVSFDESYRLCGQCHGDKYRDWREGVHGRRTGYWNGDKKYLLCVSCHDSHAPRFKPLPPEPPPSAPTRTE